MIKKFSFGAIFLFFCYTSDAQTDTIFRFLNHNYEPVPEKGADFPSICIVTKMEDGNYSVLDFHAESGKILSQAYYTDSTFKKRGGPYKTFFTGGKARKSGFYHNGVKSGLWRTWYENGQISDSAYYDNQGQNTGIRLQFRSDGKLSDSTNYGLHGQGQHFSWYANGVKREEGQLINEFKTGLWKFYYKTGVLSAEETYDRDSVVAIRCFDETGNAQPGECIAEKDAEFPGGTSAWTKYIIRKIQAAGPELAKKAQEGTIYIVFIVDIDGKVSDAKVTNPTGNYLEEVGLRIIRSSPKWIPAKQHNVLVKAYRRQPFTYTLDEE